MRKLHLLIKIALRNIFRQPRRSSLTILAISFSVFCIIIFQALKVGLHQKMIDGSLSLDLGTIQIHTTGYEANFTQFQTLPQFNDLQQKLTENGLTSYSIRIKAPALILAGTRSSSILLSGILPDQEKNITLIHRRLTAGEYVTPGIDALLIGQKLAENLKLKVGDKVSLMLQNVYGQPVFKKMSIGGFYDTGLSSFDQSHLYLPLGTLQKLLEVDNEVTEIAVSTKTDNAKQIAERLSTDFGQGKYQITHWQEMAPDLVQLMELNDATFNLLVIIIFFIVAMGIANTMNSVIFERFREFGTIAAIGTTPSEIISLVSFESLFLGIFACITGTIAALLVCIYLYIYGIDLSHFTSSNQYFAAGSVLKAFVLPQDIISANLITLLAALLAGLYPAIKASMLNPVDALNYT
jgi:ABC-type lipoprotein release transport system permease subunit